MRNFIIVDDEQDVRQLIRGIVGRCFAASRIFEATSGQEAVQLLESHGADAMIIDHHIPLLDGLSLVRLLRAQHVKIPLLVISNNPQIEKESAAAGATRFLHKREICEALEDSLASCVGC